MVVPGMIASKAAADELKGIVYSETAEMTE
jgi:hypothetical protein